MGMLALKRQKHEKIIIGNGLVVITVVGLGPGWVRLGIDAPEEMRVDREEIHLRRGVVASTQDGKCVDSEYEKTP